VRQGYIEPVVSKENTISTGPPGGEGPLGALLAPSDEEARERQNNIQT